MEQSKEKNAPWLSVPQFGDWDQKGGVPDYSLDFSKIREMRKQNKTNLSRASLGNEEELVLQPLPLQTQATLSLYTSTPIITRQTLQRQGGASSATSTAV